MKSKLIIFSAYMILSSAASALSLNEIADFSDRICVPKGERTDVQMRADLNAAVDGLFSKIIDVDGSAAVDRRWYKYASVMQEKIEGKTLDPATCRQEVARDLMAQDDGEGE